MAALWKMNCKAEGQRSPCYAFLSRTKVVMVAWPQMIMMTLQQSDGG